jgi:LmbE family N-acetylglucosaminyl deacetylase
MMRGMATLVSFHAHPDDESIATGGTMAKAAADGHRVVLVVATRGELGEPVPGVLVDGEQLWERRVLETERSAEILGAKRVEFLGYEDSGMMDEPTNENEASFWQADVEEAAERLAAILRDEDADVLTVYDDHGGYGHPDHIQVHRVGMRAAELAGVEHVFESTMNRTRIRTMVRSAREAGELTEAPDVDGDQAGFGTEEEDITHSVDVSAFVDRKLESMKAHASQIGPEHFFLTMAPEVFAAAFGHEWYIEHGATRAPDEPFGADLFAAVSAAEASS